MIHDVAIIGAGPAGACAGYELARRGLNVVIVEKERLPRYKTCGGGVVLRAQKRLPLSMAPAFEREIHAARMTFLSTGAACEVRSVEPLISMTMRATLDHLLTTEAQRAGCHLAQETRVSGLDWNAEGVTLDTSAGRISARFVIAADGVHSATARAAGWPAHRELMPALECELTVSEEEYARFSETARFDFDIPSRGYAWVFPKRDHLSVGVLSVRPREPDLNRALKWYLNAIGLTRVLAEERHGYLIPLKPRARNLAHNRILLAGDAAGLADPVTAEGISAAIESGQMAADSLIEAGLRAGEVEERYNSWVKERVFPELRAGRWLAHVLYGHPSLRQWLFRRRGPQLTRAMVEVLKGNRTYREMLADWRSYWQLLAAQPAASP